MRTVNATIAWLTAVVVIGAALVLLPSTAFA